jgi:hypothetical protein
MNTLKMITAKMPFIILLYLAVCLSACNKKTEEIPALPVITKTDTLFGTYGDKVTIFGSNFSEDPANNQVAFSNIAAKVETASATQLVVSVPGSALSGNIQVAVKGTPATQGPYFNVVKPGTPVISRIDPPGGSEPGKAITVTGTGFDPDYNKNAVALNGAAATVLNATTTSLFIAVPGRAATGPVTVTANGLTSPPYLYNVTPVNPLADGRIYYSSINFTNQNVLGLSLVKGSDKNTIPGGTSLYLNTERLLRITSSRAFDIDENKDQLFIGFQEQNLNTAVLGYSVGRINTKGNTTLGFIYPRFQKFSSIDSENIVVLAVDSRSGSLYVTYRDIDNQYKIFKGNTDGTAPLTAIYTSTFQIQRMLVSQTRIYFLDAARKLYSIKLDGTDFKPHTGIPGGVFPAQSSKDPSGSYIDVNKDSDKVYWLTSIVNNTNGNTISVYDPATNTSQVLYDQNNISLTGNIPEAQLHGFLVANNHVYWQSSQVLGRSSYGINTSTRLYRANLDGSSRYPAEIYTRMEPTLSGSAQIDNSMRGVPGLLIDDND